MIRRLLDIVSVSFYFLFVTGLLFDRTWSGFFVLFGFSLVIMFTKFAILFIIFGNIGETAETWFLKHWPVTAPGVS